MLNRRRLFQITALVLILALALTACERPIPGTDSGDTGDTQAEVAPDANQGGGEPAEGGSEDTAAETAPEVSEPETSEDTAEGDTPRVDEPEATPEPAAEDAAAAEGEAAETTDDAAAETEETATETTDAATPQTHTVQAGENLYRIGLKYGISWVKLAEYNGLANPNMIKVGQELKLSGDAVSGGTADPTSTPSPMTETTYTVKAGDNLFRIGLAYGISWVQIAEANGIVNPNQIKAGDVLKIPVSTPGPTPDFTHQVKSGETLFLISLRYGVPWASIAEANEIESPYVIYVGQTLVIPGD
jgi:LysM repeat protein